jgi:hypothetical protein
MSFPIDPAVLLDPDTPAASIPSQTAMAGRLAKDSVAPACSSVITDMKVEGSNLVLTLARPTDADKAKDPKNFQIMVNGSTFLARAGDIVFEPRSRRVTFRHLPLHPSDHVRVTVLGLWDVNPYIPAPSVTCHMQVPKKPRSLVGVSMALALLLGAIAVVAYIVH